MNKVVVLYNKARVGIDFVRAAVRANGGGTVNMVFRGAYVESGEWAYCGKYAYNIIVGDEKGDAFIEGIRGVEGVVSAKLL